MLLIDHAAWESEALLRSGPQYQISALVSQTSFYRKPEVASQNVGCFLRLHCCHFHKNPDLCQMEHVPHTWRTLQSKFPDFFGKWLSVEQEGQKFRLVWKDYINLKHAPQHIAPARVVGTFLLYHFHWLCKSILYIIFIIIQAYQIKYGTFSPVSVCAESVLLPRSLAFFWEVGSEQEISSIIETTTVISDVNLPLKSLKRAQQVLRY